MRDVAESQRALEDAHAPVARPRDRPQHEIEVVEQSPDPAHIAHHEGVAIQKERPVEGSDRQHVRLVVPIHLAAVLDEDPAVLGVASPPGHVRRVLRHVREHADRDGRIRGTQGGGRDQRHRQVRCAEREIDGAP